jgi:hypothetical protein
LPARSPDTRLCRILEAQRRGGPRLPLRNRTTHHLSTIRHRHPPPTTARPLPALHVTGILGLGLGCLPQGCTATQLLHSYGTRSPTPNARPTHRADRQPADAAGELKPGRSCGAPRFLGLPLHLSFARLPPPSSPHPAPPSPPCHRYRHCPVSPPPRSPVAIQLARRRQAPPPVPHPPRSPCCAPTWPASAPAWLPCRPRCAHAWAGLGCQRIEEGRW